MEWDRCLGGLGVLLAVFAFIGFASAGEVVVHVLQTGNVTYIYTADMSPKVCNNSCTLTFEDEDCEALNGTIIKKLDNITKRVGNVEISVVNLRTDFQTGIIGLPSSQQMGEIMDTQKTELSTYLSTVITDKMNEQGTKLDTYFIQASDKAGCTAESEQCARELINAQNRANNAEGDKTTAEAQAGDMTNVAYAAVALAIFMFAVSFNLLPVFKRQFKGGA